MKFISVLYILLFLNFNFLFIIKVQNTESIQYSNKDIYLKTKDGLILHGRYYVPNNIPKKEKIPVVVIGHGSAPTGIEGVKFYTSLAKKLGVAILAYDKRGVNESEGNYERFYVESSKKWFKTLAKDMSLFIDWVKQQPEIDTNKIGLLGGSQAGWIMPLAAYKNNNVSFIIIGEGTPLSAGEEHFFSNLTDDRLNGPYTIEQADSKMVEFNGRKGFNPKHILKKLKINVLWIFGTKDPVIPVDASLRMLEKMSHPQHEIIMLDNGNHNFVNVETGNRYNLVKYIKPWLKQIKVLENK